MTRSKQDIITLLFGLLDVKLIPEDEFKMREMFMQIPDKQFVSSVIRIDKERNNKLSLQALANKYGVTKKTVEYSLNNCPIKEKPCPVKGDSK